MKSNERHQKVRYGTTLRRLDKGSLGLLDEFDTIRHVCDNPGCVNPSHLVEGTHRDNMIDMSERQRSSNQILDADDAREIKERYESEDVSYSDLAGEYGVKKGREKTATAEFFNIPQSSIQSILDRSEDNYDIVFNNDKWRVERAKVQSGDKELEPLSQPEL